MIMHCSNLFRKRCLIWAGVSTVAVAAVENRRAWRDRRLVLNNRNMTAVAGGAWDGVFKLWNFRGLQQQLIDLSLRALSSRFRLNNMKSRQDIVIFG